MEDGIKEQYFRRLTKSINPDMKEKYDWILYFVMGACKTRKILILSGFFISRCHVRDEMSF